MEPRPEIRAFVGRRFPGAVLERVAGDGSARQFHRLRSVDGPSRVLMDYGSPFEGDTDDVRLLRLFRAADLPGAAVIHGLPGEANPLTVEVSDAQLIGRIATGDRDAFRDFHDRYAARVLSYVRLLARERELAEDVVQEVFLSVWRKAASYRTDRGDVPGWLYTITRNKLVDLWRREGGAVEEPDFDFDRLEMRPMPSKQVPVYVGGHSEIALRRAARLDGWIGVNYRLDELEAYCAQLAGYRAELGRADEPYEIVASPLANPTPENVERLEGMGVTTILTSAWMTRETRAPESVEHAIDCVGVEAGLAQRQSQQLGGGITVLRQRLEAAVEGIARIVEAHAHGDLLHALLELLGGLRSDQPRLRPLLRRHDDSPPGGDGPAGLCRPDDRQALQRHGPLSAAQARRAAQVAEAAAGVRQFDERFVSRGRAG